MEKLDNATLTHQFQEHANEFGAYVSARIPSRLRSLIQPQDVLQEAYLDACRSAAAFQAEDASSVIRWLRTIVIRRLAQQIRSLNALKRAGSRKFFHGQRPHIEIYAQGVTNRTPSKEISMRETLAMVAQRLHDLPEQRKKAVELYFLQQRSLTSVGQQLNCSKNASRSLIFQACKQLRVWLGPASRILCTLSRG